MIVPSEEATDAGVAAYGDESGSHRDKLRAAIEAAAEHLTDAGQPLTDDAKAEIYHDAWEAGWQARGETVEANRAAEATITADLSPGARAAWAALARGVPVPQDGRQYGQQENERDRERTHRENVAALLLEFRQAHVDTAYQRGLFAGQSRPPVLTRAELNEALDVVITHTAKLVDALGRQLTGRRGAPGLWMAAYSDWSDCRVFTTEVDALRWGVDHTADVFPYQPGQDPREAMLRGDTGDREPGALVEDEDGAPLPSEMQPADTRPDSRDTTCYDPQCGDSTWDHDCPTPRGDYTVTNGITHHADVTPDGRGTGEYSGRAGG